MTERLDFIIFGATGYTGKHTVEEAVKLSQKKQFKWGIAGRSSEKLKDVVSHVEKKTGKDLSKVSVVLADVGNPKSLEDMAEKCKVLVNCCGPYRFFGEPVIQACIKAKTHHVDVSGEPQYMEKMQLLYNQAAADQGVFCVSACGFDSIPADMGTIYTQQQFGGLLNSVETYLDVWNHKGFSGAAINYGTWESAIYGLAHSNELKDLRRKLYPTRLTVTEPKLKARPAIHKSTVVDNYWCVPFLGSDRSVVMRSQRHFHDVDGQQPVQMAAYLCIKSLWGLIILSVFGLIFSALTKFSLGRKLLLKHPKFFSAGYFSHEGPLPEEAEATEFSMTFYGEGWKTQQEKDLHAPISKNMITKVSGTNPGYGATCVSLLISALVILEEKDKIPGNGGVLPPGAAFAKTTMINQLCDNGFKFEVVSSQETK